MSNQSVSRWGTGKQRASVRSLTKCNMTYRSRLKIAGFLFVAPTIIYFGVFWLYPIAWGFWVSLTKWNIIGDMQFVGLENYKILMMDERFIRSLWNTAYYAVLVVAGVQLLGLVMALILNSKSIYLRGLIRTAYFVPTVASVLVVTLVWKIIYNPSFGPLIYVTRALGFPYVPWLHSTTLAMPALIMMSVWQMLGMPMVIYLAGLQSIPSELYEAGKIDGTTKVQAFWYITLPVLKPTSLFVFMTSTINAFKMFIPAYQMTYGGPMDRTLVGSLYMYLHGFQYFNMGYASSIAFVLVAIVFVVSAVQFRIGRTESS